MSGLFDAINDAPPALELLADGAVILRRFALASAPVLWNAVVGLTASAPWRHLTTPGGYRMSVAMTNAGRVGWVSDETGYRYDPADPLSGHPWPALPVSFSALALAAAEQTGYSGFEPDCCLINRYEPGARLSLHQDRDERDFSAPIVSVSLGLPAIFLFGGQRRQQRPLRVRLAHGDVVVWGGASRLAYHGVAPMADGEHPMTGRCRVNLTFRRAL